VEGTSIPLGWEVANVSPTNATGGTWKDAVYLSSNAVLDGGDVRLTSLDGPAVPLAAGSNYPRSTSVTVPGNLPAGGYFLLFVANDDGGQAETDSLNPANDVVARPI